MGNPFYFVEMSKIKILRNVSLDFVCNEVITIYAKSQVALLILPLFVLISPLERHKL